MKRLNVSGVPEGEDSDGCSRLGYKLVHFGILWVALVPEFPVDWLRRSMGFLHSLASLC